MKRTFIRALGVFVMFSLFFMACQKDVKHQGNEIGEGEPVSLTLSLTGDFLEITETPLSRASQSNNLYGLQIYSSPVNEDNYTAYGYGLFYGGEEIKVDLPNNLKYKIEASVVIDGKNKVYSAEVNGKVFYDVPFLTVADNLLHLDTENSLYSLNKSEGKVFVSGEEGESFLRPELDRYYGELSEVYPNNYVSSKVELEAKRVVSGLKFIIKDLEGSIDAFVENGPVFSIDNEEKTGVITLQKVFSLYGLEGVYSERWFANPKDELNVRLVWNKTDGSSMVLYNKSHTFQRKINYNFNIDLSKYNYTGDEHEIIITLEDGEWDGEEEIDLFSPVADGSILLEKKVIYLSEINPSEQVNLLVNQSVVSWMKIEGEEKVAFVTPLEGTGNTSLAFTQGIKYDNTVYKFANMNTFQYDSVLVSNLLLSVPKDTVNIPVAGGTFVVGDITALGGDCTWKVLETPNWISFTEINADNELVIEVTELQTGSNAREGVVRIAHINDENYSKEIYIQQGGSNVSIGDFDYMLVKFLSKAYEEEIPSVNFAFSYAAEIMNSGVEEIDEKPIGYMLSGNNSFSDVRYPAEISGDIIIASRNTNSQEGGYRQSLIFYLNTINNPDKPLHSLINRYIDIDVYGYWYYANKTYPLAIELEFYKEGTMIMDSDLGFINQGGTLVYSELLERTYIDGSTQVPPPYGSLDYRTTTKIVTLTYDKVNRTGTLARP